MQAIRGATTVPANTVEAIREAVTELLDEVEKRNQFDPNNIVSVIFSATRDLDAIFPAAIARNRPRWDEVALLDVQQMHVIGSLERCIRVLIYLQTPQPREAIVHPYLREAARLRPDRSLASL